MVRRSSAESLQPADYGYFGQWYRGRSREVLMQVYLYHSPGKLIPYPEQVIVCLDTLEGNDGWTFGRNEAARPLATG